MAARRTATTTALTREDLADAALRLLEREGSKGLSMRKVAAEVGVQAASLYWHVQNKEELLDLAGDALWEGYVPLPPGRVPTPGDWRECVAIAARRLRTHLLAHASAVRVLAGRFAPGARAFGPLEETFGLLRRLGFGPSDTALASYTVMIWVQGFVLHEAVPMSAAEERGATPAEAAALARDRLVALPAERYPHLVELADELTAPDMESRFEFGLARLLDGLETLRAAGPR
ncbi:TetR/AcrR family transcriptional regulator [Streptomyces sp. I05A-00742]|uniref:TetR/AcrR family transcriptional regulator n=1 Tax=Streptomyces sp. I05A-00742 TaxID=2732853 RepID=UPI001489E7C4|nr:TetR/AcrR family transcriptional regulator [Streptomyces sp. I05A-00742]